MGVKLAPKMELKNNFDNLLTHFKWISKEERHTSELVQIYFLKN